MGLDIKIHKFLIESGDTNIIKMPEGTEILHCGLQRSMWCLWVKLDINKPMISRIINVYETGESMRYPEEEIYIGTFKNGMKIHHVFEKIDKINSKPLKTEPKLTKEKPKKFL